MSDLSTSQVHTLQTIVVDIASPYRDMGTQWVTLPIPYYPERGETKIGR